jgi:hypothetical protein
MSTNYPNLIDAFINPTAEDDLDSAVVPHDQQHANANETVIGTNPAGSFATVKDRIISIEESLGTISSQDSNNVNITGGSIVGLTLLDNITINGGTF